MVHDIAAAPNLTDEPRHGVQVDGDGPVGVGVGRTGLTACKDLFRICVGFEQDLRRTCIGI